MFSEALRAAADERGISQRAIAKQLGYKQSVVLSHMALGRVPIPLERAAQLADMLLIDKRAFLAAVLAQRLPGIDWSEVIGPGTASGRFGELVSTLQTIAHGSLDSLAPGQKSVMREVVADRYAAERWLSVHEVPTVSLLRSLRPEFGAEGLSRTDLVAIKRALTGVIEDDEIEAIF